MKRAWVEDGAIYSGLTLVPSGQIGVGGRCWVDDISSGVRVAVSIRTSRRSRIGQGVEKWERKMI